MADVELDLRVRYHEVDQLRVAYHPRVFAWFEEARHRLLEALGHPYPQLEAEGLALPVVGARCEWQDFPRFDEWLKLEAWLEEASDDTLRFGYRLLREGAPCAVGETVHRPARCEDLGPARLPSPLLEALGSLPSQGGPAPVLRARDPEWSRLVRHDGVEGS